MNTQKITLALTIMASLLSASASSALEAKFQNNTDHAIKIAVKANHCVTYIPDQANTTLQPNSSAVINLGDRNDLECSSHYSLGWQVSAYYEPLEADIRVGEVSFDYNSGFGHFGASGSEVKAFPGVVGENAHICYKTSSSDYNTWGAATASYTFGPEFLNWACAPSVSDN
jgi:hypothetical protein